MEALRKEFFAKYPEGELTGRLKPVERRPLGFPSGQERKWKLPVMTWNQLWSIRCEEGRFKYVGQFWEWLEKNFHPPVPFEVTDTEK